MKRTRDRWIRRFHITEGALRLLCLPHAGGTASGYYWLSEVLSPQVEVLAVQYPGRQDRLSEPVIDDIGTLAGELRTALDPWLDRPFALFGHSMGALLAFELAQALEATATPPRHLVVSAQVAPSRVAEVERITDLGADEFAAAIEALGGIDPQVLADKDLRSLVMPAIHGDYTANENYRCAPGATTRVPITVLTGDRDPDTTLDQARLWQEHTTAGFDLKVYDGGHFFLEQHPESIRDLLRGLLA